MKQEFKDNKKEVSELLSRGDAIKKIGGYAALTALGTFMILNPQKAQAFSIANPGGGGGFPCDDGNPATCCPDCYDSDSATQCPTLECDGSIDFITGDCNTGTPCPPGGGETHFKEMATIKATQQTKLISIQSTIQNTS